MMKGLARWCFRHRWLVIAGWLGALLVLAGVARAAGSQYANDFSLSGYDSDQASQLLQEKFPAASGDSDQIVFHTTTGSVRDAAVRDRMEPVLSGVAKLPHVASVQSPYAMGSQAISADGASALATVQFDAESRQLPSEAVQAVIDTAQSAQTGTLQVELGGQAIAQTQRERPASEAIAVGAAIVVLLVTFGSVVAMGLPILTALLALGAGLSVITLLTHLMSISLVAPTLAAMISLGVGIDYALFIVSRYRAALAQGSQGPDAVVTAVDTSGRAVLFAGSTVVIALLGMLLLGVSFIIGMAVAAAVGVLLTMVASLTLLPAVLALLGPRVNRLRVPGRHPERATAGSPQWVRWAGFVQRHPWLTLTVCAGLLLLLTVPALSLRLGSSDAGSDPPTTTTRRAYDLLAEGFGPGFNGPLLLVAELPSPGGTAALDRLRTAVRADPDVAQVTPARLNPAGDTATIRVYPRSAPQDAATTDLVRRLRDTTIPDSSRGSGLQVHVGGTTATFIDLGSLLTSRLPLFIGGVVALSLLLLLLVFRSVAIPLKAAAMNLLSIGAAFGVLVAVFQSNWGGDLLGITRAGPIESFLPVMLFAILFGLSMDYEVFLLTRVQEEWVRSGDNAGSVRDGLAATGAVITAAAAIMIVVFTSFFFGGQRITQELGLGLASAVLVDAVVIRSALVPATMQILGRYNWYLPRWLGWLPRLHVEATPAAPAAPSRDQTMLTSAARHEHEKGR
jgi:RND superfamily putative drug exporter